MVFLKSKQMSIMHIPICQVNIGKFSTAVWQHKSTYLQTVCYVWHYRSLKRNYILYETIKDEITIWLITANMNQASWLDCWVMFLVLFRRKHAYSISNARPNWHVGLMHMKWLLKNQLFYRFPTAAMPEKTSYCHTI